MGKKKEKMAGEICLYGTWKVGHGWIARAADGKMYGTGEPVPGRTATEAYWYAAIALREAGHEGTLKVYAPGGELMAEVKTGHLPIFGALEWKPAPVYTISAEALIAAAKEGA